MTGDDRPRTPPGHEPDTPQPPQPGGRRERPAHLRLVRGPQPPSAGPGPGDDHNEPGGLHGDLHGDLDGGLHGDLDGDLDEAEQALRAMLHRAVEDLRPSPGALQRIQQAVPQRQARRRQAWLGTAAALLLAAAAVPAVRSAADHQLAGGGSASHTVQDLSPGAAASASRPVGGTWAGGTGSSSSGPAGATGTPSGPPSAGGSTLPSASAQAGIEASVSPGTPATSSQPSQAFSSAQVPACRAGQLGSGTAEVDPADSTGKVYGAFSLTNVSGTTCAVDGGGTVQVSSVQGTDPSRIAIVAHTSGDPATALPDPSESGLLVLPPGASYLVKFGYVPDGSNVGACATPQSGGSGSPTAVASSGSGASPAAGTEGTGVAASDGSSGPPAAQTSVSLTHTPSAGAPTVGPATIEGACSGTVYRTGPLPAD